MADTTSIEWTRGDDGTPGATWNPTVGCTKVSPGCDHCYALTLHERFHGKGSFDTVTLHPERLDKPLHWRKPRRVFVNSMSDLFHADVPDDYIAKVFAVMAATPQHTYQCLTKRHARMRSLLNSQTFRHQVAQALDAVTVEQAHNPHETWAPIPGFPGYQASSHGRVRSGRTILATGLNPRTGREAVTLWNRGEPKTVTVHRAVLLAHDPDGATDDAEVCHRNGDKTDNRLANLRWGTRSENQREKVRHGSRGGPQRLTEETVAGIRAARQSGRTQQSVADEFSVSRSLVSMIEHGKVWAEPELTWPLPNLWMGVSVETQQWADIRVPALLDTPAAVRFLSCEPLLGPVDLTRWHWCNRDGWDYRGAGSSRFCRLYRDHEGPCRTRVLPGLDWVIAGAESGHGARPMDEDWVRSLRDQCTGAGVAFFYKQNAVNGKKIGTPELDGRVWAEYPQAVTA